ncbi:hypothetical protein E3N88_00750 [Mikania micrantha]|uniref:FAR1 domain-containing protein n=1 Tax=Mikania micrantha TaxID=192012 RepID=A0A5N6PZ10_9ASTR|nr:hypothetical protein E3N88_00750 [Mikania micrantha]
MNENQCPGEKSTSTVSGIFYTPNVGSPSKPRVGMVFNTLDEAFIFYQKYAKLAGFTVRKTTQSSIHGIVTKKYFVCSKEGKKASQKTDTLNDDDGAANKCLYRRNRASKRTGCKALIKLMLTDAKQYRIYAFEERHNHDFVDKEDYHLLHASRKLSVVQEQLISDLSMMNIGPVKAFNIMRVRYGGFEDVGVTAVDCKNFRRDLNTFIGEYDCDMAVKHLLSKKKSFHLIFIVIISSEKMKLLLVYFGLMNI